MTRKVLVVDDDADTREIVKGIIELLGYSVFEAADGETALQLFSAERPDLIILDIMMPGMDGNEVRRRIREELAGNLVGILMLTAKDSLEDKVRSLESGANDYLTKPFHYRELQARIEALMRIRMLMLELEEKNRELEKMQAQLVVYERQKAVTQLAGTATHELGQPLSAIVLNAHVLEMFSPPDPRHTQALQNIKSDAKRMVGLLEQLRGASAANTTEYGAGQQILNLSGDTERR